MNKNIITFLLLFGLCFGLSCCQDSLEEKAANEAKEYTERCCPTPVINCSRTDSLTFDIPSKTFTYHISFVDQLDNAAIISKMKKELHDGLKDMVLNNASYKVFDDKGYRFKYVIRSGSNPKTILFTDTFKK